MQLSTYYLCEKTYFTVFQFSYRCLKSDANAFRAHHVLNRKDKIYNLQQMMDQGVQQCSKTLQ